MYPLLAEDASERGYLTLDEAVKAGVLKVGEVSATGSVPELAVENTVDKPVLLMDGEHLVGAKQDRVLTISLLAPPRQKIVIPVACVEQGRWHDVGGFAPSGYLLFAHARARKAYQVSEQLKARGCPEADQGTVWRDVEEKLSRMQAHSPTMAMAAAYEHNASDIEGFVRALEPEAGQVGAIFYIGGDISGLDLFDHAETLRLQLPKLVRSYALDAIEPGAAAEQKAPSNEEAEAFLRCLVEASWELRTAVGLGEWARLNLDDYSGGALCHGGRVVHMFAAMDANGARRPETHVVRFGRRYWRMPGE